MNRREWLIAVTELVRTIQGWAPTSVQSTDEPSAEDPSIRVLILSKGDRRVTVEPASWDRDHLPTSVDAYSNWGQRLRFRGPFAQKSWEVYTSDGVRLPVAWDRKTVNDLLNTLLTR